MRGQGYLKEFNRFEEVHDRSCTRGELVIPQKQIKFGDISSRYTSRFSDFFNSVFVVQQKYCLPQQ